MSIVDPAVDAEPAFDPRRAEVMQCPFPHYDRLRAGEPVHRMAGELVGRPGETVHAVTRYDLASEVLSDWRTYSSRFGTPGAAPPPHLLEELRAIAAQGYGRPPTMLTADPPVHTRYRRLVSKAFTPGRVAELAPTIEAICTDLCDRLDEWVAAHGSVEMLDGFCVPIPTRTIAAALGIPQDRAADFKRWADASIASIGTQLDDDGWRAAAHGVVELQTFFAAEFEARRSEPRDDLLTALLDARLSPEDGVEGEPLSMGELLSVVQQLQVAGSETTASLIADAVVFLDGRDDWDRLAEDADHTRAVVEEALRLSSPNQGLFRAVTVDTELGGVPIPAGSTMWVLFGAANRDPDEYPDPERLDPGRPRIAQHLAFGRGPHYCIGAPLARLEATIALTVLARRYARVEVVEPDALEYRSSFILRGLEHLEVRLHPR